jgi:anti-sigma-K factor RskA
MTSCQHRDDAGPWVLGALDHEQAAAFAAHLERCEACRAEVARLQGVSDILPMAVPQLRPAPALKQRIMATVHAEAEPPASPAPQVGRAPARRRRRLAAVMAAAVVAAVLVVGAALLVGGDDTRTHPGFGPSGSQVALRVQHEHGRLVLDHMPAPPRGRVYQVWLVRGRQAPRPTRTLFTGPRDGRARIDIPDSLVGSDRVLITSEPPGGSRRPTSDPVAGVDLG